MSEPADEGNGAKTRKRATAKPATVRTAKRPAGRKVVKAPVQAGANAGKTGGKTVAKAKTRAKASKTGTKAATKPTPASPLMPEADIETAFMRWRAANPAPRSDLDYSDAYTLLVAVMLSAQATDEGVNKATRRLYAEASTPAAMVALGEDRVRELIRTIGLYRNKARNAVALSQALLDRHGGAVPASREALQALPGVGRKTANVVLNIAFEVPEIAVDTHIFRVSNRMGLAPGANVDAVEARLHDRVPAAFKLHAHHWLILHGRYVCKARRPDCATCGVRDLCRWPDKAA